MQYSHQYWMSHAIELLRTGDGATGRRGDDEVPVCALIVKDNELLSIATNKVESHNDSTAHAEILAIREASKVLNNWRLNDCILYVTLEPCSMCLGAIKNSRISKVVFGAYDTNKENEVEVIGGILELESAKFLKDFFAVRR